MKTAVSGYEEDFDVSNEGRYRQRLNTLAANWRALALRGLVALLFGLVVLFWPGLVFAVLAVLFGIYALVDVIVGWALATGMLKILTAILLRAEVANGWLLAGSGALSVLFGILLAVLAGADVPFLAPFIGAFAVIVGLALIVFAFRLRERRR